MWVKVCGVTRVDQALALEALGVDALGINLHPESPRAVTPAHAATLAAAVQVTTVLVVGDLPLERLKALVRQVQPDLVQLHGEAPLLHVSGLGAPALVAWRASSGVLDRLRAKPPGRFLLDAHVPGIAGGTGRQVDLRLAAEAATLGELILAGGLRPDNVGAAVAAVRPWGVDVASGVERSPGVKDLAAVSDFIAAARSA